MLQSSWCNKTRRKTIRISRTALAQLEEFGKMLFYSRLPNVETSKANMVHEDDDQSDSARTNETSIYSEPGWYSHGCQFKRASCVAKDGSFVAATDNGTTYRSLWFLSSSNALISGSGDFAGESFLVQTSIMFPTCPGSFLKCRRLLLVLE